MDDTNKSLSGRVVWVTGGSSGIGQHSAFLLANTGENRSPMALDIPTIAELGFPEATSEGWFGLHAPTDTPKATIQALASAAQAAIADPAVQERIRNVGAEPAFMPTDQFVIFLEEEKERGQRFLNNIGHVPQ